MRASDSSLFNSATENGAPTVTQTGGTRRAGPPTSFRVETIGTENNAWNDRCACQPCQGRCTTLGCGAFQNGRRARPNAAFWEHSHHPPGAKPFHPDPQRAAIRPRTIDRKGIDGAKPGPRQSVTVEFRGGHPVHWPSKGKGEIERIKMRNMVGNQNGGAGRFHGTLDGPDLQTHEWPRKRAQRLPRGKIAPTFHRPPIAQAAPAS